MEDSTFYRTMLFDFYAQLLTPRQRELYDLYYNEDLSLAEIAENVGITRQGVRDGIVRAEAILRETEEKTGIIARFLEVRAAVRDIEENAAKIEALNAAQLGSRQLGELIGEIRARLAEIKE